MLYKLIFFVSVFFCQHSASAQSPIAIMGALPEEIAAYHKVIDKPSETIIFGIHFTTGSISNHPIVVVETGVGKVNAAMVCTLLLDHFKPSRVIFTGVAGGIGHDVKIGDVVIADSVVQHDFGTLNEDNSISNWGAKNPINGQRNPVFFKTDSLLLHTALQQSLNLILSPLRLGGRLQTPTVKHGTVATGDLFISSPVKKLELAAKFHADAVEMEGAAVAQICYQQQVPFLIIRSISDLASNDARISFAAFVQVAAQNAAHLVTQLVQALPL